MIPFGNSLYDIGTSAQSQESKDRGSMLAGSLGFRGGALGFTACTAGDTVATVGSGGAGVVSYANIPFCVVGGATAGAVVTVGAYQIVSTAAGNILQIAGQGLKDAGTSTRLTSPQATKRAADLGYKKVKGKKSHGQPIYKKTNKKAEGPDYISPDADGHNGGVWKGADNLDDFSKTNRTGTLDGDLKK